MFSTILKKARSREDTRHGAGHDEHDGTMLTMQEATRFIVLIVVIVLRPF
jgi:hypothetical protein